MAAYRRYPFYRLPAKPVLGSRSTRRGFGDSGLGYVTGSPAAVVQTAAPAVPWYQKIIGAVAPLATTAVSVYQQSRFDKMNRERLSKGLAPIPVEQYRAAIGPTATAEIGLSPATQRLLIYGGLGLAAALLLPRLLKR